MSLGNTFSQDVPIGCPYKMTMISAGSANLTLFAFPAKKLAENLKILAVNTWKLGKLTLRYETLCHEEQIQADLL